MLFLFNNAYSSTPDNSTLVDLLDQENETFTHFNQTSDDNSTLISDIQNLQKRNASITPKENSFLRAIQSRPLETFTTPAINLFKNVAKSTTSPKNSTQTPKVPIQINSRSKINQLLEAIDSRLKNSSMLLDSHVLVMQNANGAVNVTRTWSFQPNRFKGNGSLPFNRTVVARVPFRPHRRLSSHMSRFVPPYRRCERLTEQQKYIRLQSVGGLNQQYMANSPVEAARNFPRLLPSFEDASNSMNSMFSDAFNDASEFNRPLDNFCDENCEEIRSKLEEVLLDERLTTRQLPVARRQFFDTTSGDDSAAEDAEPLPEPMPKSQKRGCRLERFIPIGNCTSRGEEEFWDYEKLCTACQGVYMLSNDCFPTFLNSVICDKHETACIFDRYTGAYCEDWQFVYLEVPVACECFLSKTSWLDSQPHSSQRD
ncbi:hypothetical protein M3Y97_00026900 [Aphelenchoides bicaudatus]|nr:hypothetical protein M3Y97_00026900 [Aphelenchoides bicaudatus]